MAVPFVMAARPAAVTVERQRGVSISSVPSQVTHRAVPLSRVATCQQLAELVFRWQMPYHLCRRSASRSSQIIEPTEKAERWKQGEEGDSAAKSR